MRSPNAAKEVGSIHTVQGYDLDYAGVIIGPDLRYDQDANRFNFDRTHYFDKKGMENYDKLGITHGDDDDILKYVISVYVVLLTRGVKGTYVYACDPATRNHLRKFF